MPYKKSNKFKVIVPLICVFVIIAIISCCLIIPGLFAHNAVQINLCQGEQKDYAFGEGYKAFVKTASGILYINEKTSAVAIAAANGEIVFNSHSKDAAEDKLACVLAVTFRDKVGNAYIKNSSINSADSGKLEVTSEKKNSAIITFSFTDNETGAVSEVIPIKFSEDKGGIKAEIDLAEVTLQDGFCIEKISILPGLFSESNPKNECFYTIPDGCGIQMDLTARAEKYYSQTLDVYGSDISFSEYSQGATLPCFAMTKNGVMVTTVIDEGDALSSIYVKHNKNIGGSLYNTFVVTPYARIDDKLVKGSAYDGVISQIYYISSKGECNYNTVSSIVRDKLIEKDYLPSAMSEVFVDFPFFITAIGSENGKKNSVYTTFENGSEIIALLKSRGVRSVALRFAGTGDKGLNSGAAGCDELSSVLGGQKDYNKLCDVAAEKNSSVWCDVNLSLTPNKNAKNTTSLYSDLRNYISKDNVNSKIGSYQSAYSNISKAYDFVSQSESGNVCVNDLSYLLYTDIIGRVDRQASLNSLQDKIQSLSVSSGLMLTSPAVYIMKQADAVFSVTQSAALSGSVGVTTVPLLQMVLHGSVCYGSEPVNLFQDSQDAVLKAVEYGAVPSFVFTYDKCDVLNYGIYATQTAKFYASAKRMLPLMDMKITSHEQVVSGVYKITYDYSKVVYVNYNPSVVEVNGILVSAKDFIVI